MGMEVSGDAPAKNIMPAAENAIAKGSTVTGASGGTTWMCLYCQAAFHQVFLKLQIPSTKHQNTKHQIPKPACQLLRFGD
jgi:hypothetical protein